MREFIETTVLKSDLLSRTLSGHFAEEPDERIIRRLVSAAPLWTRPLAWFLAWREIRALKAVDGIEGVPHLIATDRHGLYRSWVEGTPLHLATPDNAQWYRQAHRLLRTMRERNVTHNDLAKPQNWLVTPDGTPAVIDFQLASVHRRRTGLARMMAYEDLRHLLKHKKRYAGDLLTPTERRILQRKALLTRIWMRTGKRAYNFVTRRLLDWSDGEGTGDRIDREGPGIQKTIDSLPQVKAAVLTTYALPSEGVGLYLFAETEMGEAELVKALSDHKISHVQTVAELPRAADGDLRRDLLHLVATSQISELEAHMRAEPELEAVLMPIINVRKVHSDRRLSAKRTRDQRRY